MMERAWYLKHRDALNAWADKGVQIQIKRNTVNGLVWEDCEPQWAENREYRVKPEPRYLWFIEVNNLREANPRHVYTYTAKTEKDAKDIAGGYPRELYNVKITKFVEVV